MQSKNAITIVHMMADMHDIHKLRMCVICNIDLDACLVGTQRSCNSSFLCIKTFKSLTELNNDQINCDSVCVCVYTLCV